MENPAQTYVDEFRQRIAKVTTIAYFSIVTLFLVWTLNLWPIPENIAKAANANANARATLSKTHSIREYRELKKKAVEARNKADYVKFIFPGYENAFELRSFKASALWNALTVSVFWYIFYTRRIAFNLLAKAVRYQLGTASSTHQHRPFVRIC